MKLYVWGRAPNPRRVKIFLAEKGIEMPFEDVGDGAVLGAAYRAKWPQATVPMLELDDGACIGEAMAICRYIEEQQPEPPLMGTDAVSRAHVDMWERRAYEEGLNAAAEIFRNGNPAFVDRGLPGGVIPQVEGLIERGKTRVNLFFDKFDKQLADNEFVAGERFSIADITAVCAIDFMKVAKITIPDAHPNLQRWHAAVWTRDSVKSSL